MTHHLWDEILQSITVNAATVRPLTIANRIHIDQQKPFKKSSISRSLRCRKGLSHGSPCVQRLRNRNGIRKMPSPKTASKTKQMLFFFSFCLFLQTANKNKTTNNGSGVAPLLFVYRNYLLFIKIAIDRRAKNRIEMKWKKGKKPKSKKRKTKIKQSIAFETKSEAIIADDEVTRPVENWRKKERSNERSIDDYEVDGKKMSMNFY